MTPRPVAALSDILDPLSGGSSSCPRTGARWRVRPSRRRERHPVAVTRALPHGSSRAPSQVAFLRAVEAAPGLAHLRADSRATVLEVARQMAWCASWETMTTRPTWERLCERTGRSRATIARALVRLREAGLVGVVATGRSATYQTSGRAAGEAEAAVYVLCVPAQLYSVDELETPTPEGLPVGIPCARESRATAPSGPLRGAPLAAAGAAEPARAGLAVISDRPAEAMTRRLRLERRRAQARALQVRFPVLRRASDAAVAAVLRDFQLEGWSTGDLGRAIDQRPDGSLWPHDGATGVAQPAKWLAYRLAAWRGEDGAVRPAPSSVSLAAARSRAAAQRAERAAELELREAPRGEGFAAFRAARASLARPARPAPVAEVHPGEPGIQPAESAVSP